MIVLVPGLVRYMAGMGTVKECDDVVSLVGAGTDILNSELSPQGGGSTCPERARPLTGCSGVHGHTVTHSFLSCCLPTYDSDADCCASVRGWVRWRQLG